MKKLLCVNARRYRFQHTLEEGKIYTQTDECTTCCSRFVRVAEATMFIPNWIRGFKCHTCGKTVPRDPVAGMFWSKRFVQINDPDLKEVLTDQEKADDLTKLLETTPPL